MKRRLVFSEGTSNKFWQIEVQGASYTVTFGKVGTAGQVQTKDLASPDEARKAADKLVAEKSKKGYLDDPSTAAVANTAKPVDATTVASDPYPFLFYGADPSEWFEAANFGHLYQIRFRSPPGAKALSALAEAFERVVHGAEALDGASRPWKWSGDWALFSLGERAHGDDFAYDRFWEEVHATMRALHAAWPIAEVVYMNVDGDPGDDPWDRWSVAQQAIPTTGPAWAEIPPGTRDHYGALQKRLSADVREEPAFESQRSKARAALSKTADAAKRQGAKGAKAAAKIVFKRSKDPPTKAVPANIKSEIGAWDWAAMGPGACAFVLSYDQEYEAKVGGPDGVRALEPRVKSQKFRYAFSPGGERLWLVRVVDGYGTPEVIEIDCTTGKNAVVHQYPTKINGIAAAGDELVIGGEKTPLRFLRTQGAPPYEPAFEMKDPAGTHRVSALRGGSVLFWTRYVGTGACGLVVFARKDGLVHEVVRSSLSPDSVVEAPDGKTYAHMSEKWHEVKNLDAAVEAALARPGTADIIVDDNVGNYHGTIDVTK